MTIPKKRLISGKGFLVGLNCGKYNISKKWRQTIGGGDQGGGGEIGGMEIEGEKVTMSPKFFITHSWKDIQFTRKLCNDLRARGLDGFFDERSLKPGESVPSRIVRGLEDCDIYIPVLSPAALQSEWCDWEIDIAITLNRDATRKDIISKKNRPHIIPVIAKKCIVPTQLRNLLYIDFEERYDQALYDLLTKGFDFSEKEIPPPRTSWFQQLKQTQRVAGAFVGIAMLVVLVSLLVNNNTPASPKPTEVANANPSAATQLPVSNTPVLVPPSAIPVPSVTTTPTPRPIPTTIPIPLSPSLPTINPPQEEMVLIPAGDFPMGSTRENIDLAMNICNLHDPCAQEWYIGEQPQHIVYLNRFSIDKFEVTNAQYKRCVDAGKCSPPQERKSPTRTSYYGNAQFDSYPVIYVRWEDAKTFCEWLGKRLPTEAEWEKAARGTDGRIFPWGNVWNTQYANSLESGLRDTVQVGSYPNGKSPYGVMDMAGNVFEWVWDWWNGDADQYYSNSPKENPMGAASGKSRVLRGGAYDRWPSALRTTQRYGFYNAGTSGFRCAK